MFGSNFNLFDLLILLGSLHGLLLATFLWREAGKNRPAVRFLALFILGFSLNSLFHTTEALGLRNGLTFYEFLPLYCSLFTIGCFALFVEYTTKPGRKWRRGDLVWLAPAAVQTATQLFFLAAFFLKPDRVLEWFFAALDLYAALDLLAVIMGLAVLVRALILIRKYERETRKSYADVSGVSLEWLRKLLLALFGIWVLFAVPTLYEQLTDKPSSRLFHPLWIATSVLIYWIGYSAYLHREVFGVRMFHEETKHSSLSKRTETYHLRLLDLMATERPWLDPALNLKTLAESLDLSGGYLSQIINQHEGKNFFDFVNGYRVARVTELMTDEDYAHLNLLGMAYEAGFKSKSTFNLAFKKLTGTTPTAYRKALKTS